MRRERDVLTITFDFRDDADDNDIDDLAVDGVDVIDQFVCLL